MAMCFDVLVAHGLLSEFVDMDSFSQALRPEIRDNAGEIPRCTYASMIMPSEVHFLGKMVMMAIMRTSTGYVI